MNRRLLALLTALTLLTSVFVAFGLSPAAAATQYFVQISDGMDQHCGVDNTGSGWCWGVNSGGELGDGTTINRNVPTAVAGGYTWKQIVTGFYTTCGLTTSGAAYCWGSNAYGQFGIGSQGGTSTTPVAVSGGLSFSFISSGAGHTCAITAAGAGYCWGVNGNGRLGTNDSVDHYTPTAISGGLTLKYIGASNDSGCGLTTTNVAYCWGLNVGGEVGDGTSTDRKAPTPVTGGYTFTTLSVGAGTTCGITNTGAAYCWGDNSGGEMGTGATGGNVFSPSAVSGGYTFSSIAAGGTVCALTTTGSRYCWGKNDTGQAGVGSGASAVLVPTATTPSIIFSQTALGTTFYSTCGLTGVGVAYCAGNGYEGALGNARLGSYSQLQQVAFPSAQSNTALSATIDPTLTFSVFGTSGPCNGTNPTAGTSSSPTAVNMGHVGSSTPSNAEQGFYLATNAGSGATVYIRNDGVLRDGAGHSFADVPGTNASPATFPAAGTSAFGYTVVGFNAWSALTTTNQPIGNMANAGVLNWCIAYQAQTSSVTPAGSYSSTITYTAVPTF